MYQRILVPVDGSATSDAGLAEAIKLGTLTGAALRLVHVVDLMPYAGFDLSAAYTGDLMPLLRAGGKATLAAAGAKVQAAGLNFDTQLLETFLERASESILTEAKIWNADLIVIGTHGRRGIDRLVMGSDAEQVLRQASAPVLLVRARPGKAADKD